MKKPYVIVPMLGLILFGGLYWNHLGKQEARAAGHQRLEEAATQEHARLLAAERILALQQAAASVERRKQEKAQQAQLEESQRQGQQEAEHRRSIAVEANRKLRARLERHRADLAALQKDLAQIEERKVELQREQQFLAEHVREVEANRDAFYQLLEKVEARERQPVPTTTSEKSGNAQ